MLYNLTLEDENYVSSESPSSLPEENYCFIEINYSDLYIKSVKSTYNFQIEKECILSELDISEYMNKLEFFLKREDIDKDKIQLNFVENIEDEDTRIKKIFVILLSSYLIYFNFLEFPFTISLELLNNDMFKYFTNFNPTNNLEKSFIKQVSLLHRYFSTIFEDEKDINSKDINSKDINSKDINGNEDLEEKIKELVDIEIKEIAKEIKEFKKRLLADVNKNKKEIKEEIKNKFSKIFSE